MRVLVDLSFEDLNGLIHGLQAVLRNDEGLLTPEGIAFYQALHDRLDAMWGRLERGTVAAPNDAGERVH